MLFVVPILEKDMMLRSFYRFSNVAHITYVDGCFDFETWKEVGQLTEITWIRKREFYWLPDPKEIPWGERGDAFCSPHTREGRIGVIKQNWHYGPLGFQYIADGMLWLYTSAMLRALNWIANSQKPPPKPSLPFFPTTQSNLVKYECTRTCPHKVCGNAVGVEDTPFGLICNDSQVTWPFVCGTGYGPQWSPYSDINRDWYLPDKSTGKWTYPMIHHISSVHTSVEQSEGKEGFGGGF